MTIITEDLGFWGTRLATKIPKEITEKLGLREGGNLIFIHEDGKKYAIIGTKDMLRFKDKDLKQIAPAALGLFSKKMDKEDLDLILREMGEKENP